MNNLQGGRVLLRLGWCFAFRAGRRPERLDNTLMFFSDAKKAFTEMIAAVKEN